MAKQWRNVWGWTYFLMPALGSLLTGVPRCFCIDELSAVVPTVAWKQPFAGFSGQTTPVFAQFLEQFWAEHHISVSASLAALDVNDHPPAVDVADFQVCQLGVAHSGCVERQQQNAMVGSKRCIDELRDFFLAQDRRKMKWPFRIDTASPVPVIRENVISCLRHRVAREPALGVVPLRRLVSQGAGSERIRCSVIEEDGPSPPAAVREPLAVLYHEVDASWPTQRGPVSTH